MSLLCSGAGSCPSWSCSASTWANSDPSHHVRDRLAPVPITHQPTTNTMTALVGWCWLMPTSRGSCSHYQVWRFAEYHWQSLPMGFHTWVSGVADGPDCSIICTFTFLLMLRYCSPVAESATTSILCLPPWSDAGGWFLLTVSAAFPLTGVWIRPQAVELPTDFLAWTSSLVNGTAFVSSQSFPCSLSHLASWPVYHCVGSIRTCSSNPCLFCNFRFFAVWSTARSNSDWCILVWAIKVYF